MRVVALASYPERMASTRFRVSRYLPHLAARGIDVRLVSALDDVAAASLYAPGGALKMARAAVEGVGRQIAALARGSDVVWVQREALLAGPPLVEALATARGLRIVLDYDDAIWIAQGSALRRATRFAWKFDWVLRRAVHATAGSERLADRARALGVPATVLPTAVEREVWTPGEASSWSADPMQPLVIGWVGTHTTAPQLALVAPALRKLRADGHRFRVLIIGAGSGFRLEGVEIETRAWALEREIDDFRAIDIGVTPMLSTPWHEGKCGFKQVQFMAVGVPFVSSLVGGARDFLVHEQNALVAHAEDDWYVQLRRLLVEAELRSRLASAGRALVEQRLCIEVQADTLARVLRDAANPPS